MLEFVDDEVVVCVEVSLINFFDFGLLIGLVDMLVVKVLGIKELLVIIVMMLEVVMWMMGGWFDQLFLVGNEGVGMVIWIGLLDVVKVLMGKMVLMIGGVMYL